jgi:diguanylate cyclase (GGDEF)-like protein
MGCDLMKPATARSPSDNHDRGRAGARHRFAIGGLALALCAALGTPALARVLARSWSLPIEVALIATGIVVALGFVAAGWVLGRRVDRLSDEARRDPVTRVGNRRHWEECLSQEVLNAARAGMPLSLLMLDVDNLKKLNDVGGHVMGDRALAVVGDVLNDTCRSRDVAARFGGDEFAVLLPRTRASEAYVVAERIRDELARRRHELPGPLDSLLSVSVGICDLASLEEPRANLLFDAADRALYSAKQGGRDRIMVFEKVPVTSSVIILDERRRARKKKTNSSC